MCVHVCDNNVYVFLIVKLFITLLCPRPTRACVRACMCACVRACMCACVRACVRGVFPVGRKWQELARSLQVSALKTHAESTQKIHPCVNRQEKEQKIVGVRYGRSRRSYRVQEVTNRR